MALLKGLLDGNWSDDPNRNEAMNSGLLAASMALLGNNSRNFGEALGKAGLVGLNNYQGELENGQQRSIRQMAMDRQKKMQEREDAMNALPQQFYRTPTQTALAGGGGPTLANAQKLEGAQPSFDMGGYAQALAQFDPARSMQMQAALQKNDAPTTVAPGAALWQGGKEVFRNDKAEKTDPFVALMQSAGIDPASPQGRQFLAAKLRKESEFAPPMQVNSYGSPVAASDANGNPIMVQTGSRGGPAQMVTTPDGRPVKPAAGGANSASEDERKAAGWFTQASKAFSDMEAAVKESPSAAKPNIGADLVRKIPLVGDGIGNSMLSESRQKFEQGASAFSEAALRAATGAGVNKDEAMQKIKELTPVWGDKPATIAQKKASMQMYLGSLQLRAGRAMPQGGPAPASNVMRFDANGNML